MVAPVNEKVVAVKKSIAALVGKIEVGGEQLNWYSTCFAHISLPPPPTHTPYRSVYPIMHTYSTPCRPSVLDSFSTLSGQTSTLMRQLSSDKFPPTYNRVILPLQVSSDRDVELEVS